MERAPHVTRYSEILRLLNETDVEFIVVGGVAAVLHGSPRFAQAVDIVYARNGANLDRVVTALSTHEPSLRDAPPSLAFRFNRESLEAGLNLRLASDLGWIDLLGGLTGCGSYEDLLPRSDVFNLYGAAYRVGNLEMLIQTKRAAGRPKDFEAIAELELLRDRAPKKPTQ